VTVIWNPALLNAAISVGFRASVPLAVSDANSQSNSVSGAQGRSVTGTDGYIAPTGLGAVFEKGRRFSGTIYPHMETTLGQRAVLSTPWGPRASVAGSNMAPDPYISPAARRWAAGGFQTTARAALGAAGFR
jgi:hypothetical protein